ncbi:hypothetical protein ACFYPG_11635 [Micromonospora sp. NPDC005553]|uniref:hypothetical protein n=1 Tax=unclassified Micromonospora TaxID=2617518 RepID=UPI0033AA2D12
MSVTRSADLILPVLIVATWLVLTIARRVSMWFFGLAAGAALLCLPAGIIAGHLDLNDGECSPRALCFSAAMVDWWLNGLFGLMAVVGLAILSGVRRLLRGDDSERQAM